MIDWMYVFKTLANIGVGLGLIFGTDEYQQAGVGILAGALSQGALTANQTVRRQP